MAHFAISNRTRKEANMRREKEELKDLPVVLLGVFTSCMGLPERVLTHRFAL